jgi:hypothetical protein
LNWYSFSLIPDRTKKVIAMNTPKTGQNNNIKANEEPSIEENVATTGENDTSQTTESDLTRDDLEALGPVDLSMDGGEDEQLKQRTHPVDFSGEDLDIPGVELDDDNERIGSEDEENNSWSIGGDDHENLEEDPS